MTPCHFGFKLPSCLNYLKQRYKQFNFMCFLSQMAGALRIRHSCHVDTVGLGSRQGWLWALIDCHERFGLLAKGGRENVSPSCMALDSPRVLSPYLRGGWWWFCWSSCGHWCLRWSEDTQLTGNRSIHTQLQSKGKERLLLSARHLPQRTGKLCRADPGSSAALLLIAWITLLGPVQHSALMTWYVVCIVNEKHHDVPSIGLREDWVGPVPRALGLCGSSGTCCPCVLQSTVGLTMCIQQWCL